MRKSCIFLLLFLFCLVSGYRSIHDQTVPTAIVTPDNQRSPAPVTPSPSPTPTPEPTPEPVHRAVLSFTGDLMVHEWQMNDAFDRETGTYDFLHCFEDVLPHLQDTDYLIGNLETTFAGEEAGYAWYPLFNCPDSFGDALRHAGFDFLTTANNHCMDKREAGVLRTLDRLDELGLSHTGTFRSFGERDTIPVHEVNGIRFAFLSYTYGTNGIPVPEGKEYLVNFLNLDLIQRDIQTARAQDVDFVLVMPHMGIEYAPAPNENVRQQVHAILEAGADAVIASHPHVLQKAEFLTLEDDGDSRECFVAWSMGNFISSQRTEPRDTGMILKLTFEKEADRREITEASFIPTWVKFINAQGQYDIRILAVYNTLKAWQEESWTDLRQSDINRLKRVQVEATTAVLGRAVSVEEMQEAYPIEKQQ